MRSTRSRTSFWNRFHPQHAHDDLHGEGVRQQHQHPGGVVGLDHRQHNGDGLRIFVLQVAGENLLADIAELVPHGATGRATDFLHDLGDAVPGQGLQQQALGTLEAAEDAAGSPKVLYEIDAEIFDGVGGDGAKLGHGG
jgi:hypothetical protein